MATRWPAAVRRGARVAGLLSVAACGLLAGHAASYALDERTMADGRHGYFASLAQIVVALALFCGVVIAGRAAQARGDRRLCATPPFPVLWAMLASLQACGFAAMEYAEGNAPDAAGCGVQLVVALIAALAVAAFLGFVDRHVAGSAERYVRRPRTRAGASRFRTDAVRTPSRLATVAGFRRFQRPPPHSAYRSS